jgi:hypothetical protein
MHILLFYYSSKTIFSLFCKTNIEKGQARAFLKSFLIGKNELLLQLIKHFKAF